MPTPFLASWGPEISHGIVSHEIISRDIISRDIMSRLDYPFVFKCTNCGAETVVRRDDARGLHPDPDCLDAVDAALEQRGWLRGKIEGMIFCSGCANVAAEPED